MTRRYVVFRLLGSFAEEVRFHLLDDELLVFLLPRLQTVLVEQHLHVLLPLLPSQLGDVVVDALSQGAIEWRLVEALHFATHLYAIHHSCHRELLSPHCAGTMPTDR